MGYTDERGAYHAFHGTLEGLALHNWREADASADVGAIAANGGILASDTTPIMRGASALIVQEISWAASNSDPIVAQVTLPEDFDGRSDVTLEFWVNSGTTDAVSLTVATSWDGGATVTDTSSSDTATKSATTHKVTAVIAATDIPDNAAFLTVLLTPGAHTTNAIQLQGVRGLYTPKLS